MAEGRGSTSRRGNRPLLSGAGSRDVGLRLLASFPDLDVVASVSRAEVEPVSDDVGKSRPRIGWGSIGILAAVAAAVTVSGWWLDRGPIDPGSAEIERARLAERVPDRPASPVRSTMKFRKSMRR